MRNLLYFLFTFVSITAYAQQGNDDCFSAINIPSLQEYCSGDLEFSNMGAQPDLGLPEDGTATGCFNDHVNGVWFQFRPTQTAVVFNAFADPNQTTIARTNLNVYTGDCNNLEFVSCSRGISNDDELLISGLTPGQNYYLLVESEFSDITFTLCINEFNAPKSPESDCETAVVLCDKSAFQVTSLFTSGDNPGEFDEFPDACLTSEFNSSWYKWTCDEPGSLEFTLIPNNFRQGFESDDLDFALFELPGGLDDCDSKQLLRCMASGENVGESFAQWQVCNGPTGMLSIGGDTEEQAGCQAGDNNFVDPIQMVSGRSYALVVMNFSNSGLGFEILFGGTGTFLGPVPDFDPITIGAYECDKRIDVTNISESETDPIVSYSWNFGDGATPPNRNGEGPHTIEYESFGTKSITLTVETTRGCLVTKILDIDVEACCADTSSIGFFGFKEDVSCFGETDGLIGVNPTGGAGQISYSIDGGPFVPNTQFNDLPPGEYEVFAQDIKGCMDTMSFTIIEPDAIIIETSPDITVDLGYDGVLTADYTPMNPGDVITWSPPDGLSCTECLSPTVTPQGTTTYTFTVTNGDECTTSANITATANTIYEVYFPNVITPPSQDVNSIFTIGSGRQVELIEELEIYDRWGNLVFTCNDIDPNDPSRGWDGTFGSCDDVRSGRMVETGIYVYKANIRFIDDMVIPYAGDVAVFN